MEAKDIIKNLEGSKEFKEWKKERKDSFLAHIFKMFDEANAGETQAGYYNKDDTITTFLIAGDGVKLMQSEEIFKKPDAKVLKLELKNIKVDIGKALKTADEIQQKEFKAHTPIKKILILQKLEVLGQVYNITFVTQSFNILNLKIDSGTGKISEKLFKPIMDFRTNG